jgi:3-dehydroquinate synthase
LETVLFSSQIALDLKQYLGHLDYSSLGVIMDSNTEKDCLPLIHDVLPESAKKFTFPAGEKYKNLDTCLQIWEWMTQEGFDRKALIINLGGGVTGDMGGFCAATYKRGIRFINVPTSLLSQVDASVGGKLGIDFRGFKNHIGVFTQPDAVIIAEEFLKTLSEKELRSGFAEVLKHGLIRNAAYFRSLRIENWQDQPWKEIIEKSVSIKKDIVEKDPKESGLRKILNFGHTIGHAFESHFLGTGCHLLHGEAIAIGMVCEAFLSFKKCGLSKEELVEIENVMLKVFGHFEFSDKDIPVIIQLCGQDKKNESSTMYFSLLRKVGDSDYNIPVTSQEIAESIQYYRSIKF